MAFRSEHACPGCTKTFVGPESQLYCSVRCADLDKLGPLDTLLKRRFVQELRSRWVSVAQAHKEMGIPVPTLYTWIRRRDGWLEDHRLGQVAGWLAIELDEAIRLQGGHAADRRRESVRQADHPERQRLRTDKKYARKNVRAAAAAVRGAARSIEHRQRLSEAVTAYYARNPDTSYLGAYAADADGRAKQIARNYRRHHVDWTEEQVRATTALRLLEPTDNVASFEEALRLLDPRPTNPKAKKTAGPAHRHREHSNWLPALLPMLATYAGSRRPHRFFHEAVRAIREFTGEEWTDSEIRRWVDRNSDFLAPLVELQRRKMSRNSTI